jgi:hypothetical protein
MTTYESPFLVSLVRAKSQGACYVEVRGELTWFERVLLWLAGIEVGRELLEASK